MLKRALSVLLLIVTLFAAGCFPFIKHSKKDQRVVGLPSGNPDATLATAQIICGEVGGTLGAELHQRFPTLTEAQMRGAFLNPNEGTFAKTGHTVFITTGIQYQGELPESKAIADFCEAAVRRAVEARFPSSVPRAEDIAEVKTAFATLLEYQKTDDARTLDLYMQDCRVVMAYTDGKITRAKIIPPDVFRAMMTQELAKKRGDQDIYEDVKYNSEGANVRVIATVLFFESGKRGSVTLLYVRENGAFKIGEMKAIFPVDKFSE